MEHHHLVWVVYIFIHVCFSVVILVFEGVDHPQKPSAHTAPVGPACYFGAFSLDNVEGHSRKANPKIFLLTSPTFQPIQSRLHSTWRAQLHIPRAECFWGTTHHPMDDETNIAGKYLDHITYDYKKGRTPQLLLWRCSSFSLANLLTCNQSSACAEPSHRAWSVIESGMVRLTDEGCRLRSCTLQMLPCYRPENEIIYQGRGDVFTKVFPKNLTPPAWRLS